MVINSCLHVSCKQVVIIFCITLCRQDREGLIRKLKNLNSNKVAISLIKAKLVSVANDTRPVTKTSTITCSIFIKKIDVVLNLIEQDPSSGQISKIIFTIAVLTFSCNSREKSSLSSISSSLTAAEAAIAQDEISVQSTLTSKMFFKCYSNLCCFPFQL